MVYFELHLYTKIWQRRLNAGINSLLHLRVAGCRLVITSVNRLSKAFKSREKTDDEHNITWLNLYERSFVKALFTLLDNNFFSKLSLEIGALVTFTNRLIERHFPLSECRWLFFQSHRKKDSKFLILMPKWNIIEWLGNWEYWNTYDCI